MVQPLYALRILPVVARTGDGMAVVLRQHPRKSDTGRDTPSRAGSFHDAYELREPWNGHIIIFWTAALSATAVVTMVVSSPAWQTAILSPSDGASL